MLLLNTLSVCFKYLTYGVQILAAMSLITTCRIKLSDGKQEIQIGSIMLYS